MTLILFGAYCLDLYYTLGPQIKIYKYKFTFTVAASGHEKLQSPEFHKMLKLAIMDFILVCAFTVMHSKTVLLPWIQNIFRRKGPNKRHIRFTCYFLFSPLAGSVCQVYIPMSKKKHKSLNVYNYTPISKQRNDKISE